MSKHAVFVGIDGVQLSEMLRLRDQGLLPELDRFFLQESYVGGEVGTSSEQRTSSGPGWATLLTGTWVDQHGVDANNGNQVANAASSIFERVDDGITGADIYSFATWHPINGGHFNDEYRSVVDGGRIGGTDAQNIQSTLDTIAAGEAEFIFTHYDEPDHAGHSHGFGSEYDAAVIEAVHDLVRVLDAIEAREAAHPDEEWLLLSATDHGRNAQGTSHQGQTASERQSFILSNKPILQSDVPVPATSVVTTVLDHLDIDFDMNDLVSESILDDDDTNNGAINRNLIWSEDFESLESDLGAYVSATELGGDGTDWTDTGPAGWTTDDGATPTGGPAEFEGWTFHDKRSWVSTSNDQNRFDFTRGTGVVAVADPDEYDDGQDVDPGNFNAYLTTDEIDLSVLTSDTFQFVFDSSFRASGTQKAVLRASFDGGATYVDVFELDSATITNSLAHINEQIVLDLDANGADSVYFQFGLEDAGNDWWWAVDNIELWDSDPVVVAPVRNLIWSEDFESLESDLGAYVSGTESGGDGTDWTATGPAGWTTDDGTTPTGGPAEFEGWTFHDKDSWIATSNDQNRSDFTRGTGVVAVADPDEYDDGQDVDPGSFNAYMTTDEIDLSGLTTDTFQFVFDSSFRAYDDQKGVLRASFDDGATYVDVFELDSATIADDNAHINEQIVLDLDANGADSVHFQFGLVDAGNDWWWAVDNIELWDIA